MSKKRYSISLAIILILALPLLLLSLKNHLKPNNYPPISPTKNSSSPLNTSYTIADSFIAPNTSNATIHTKVIRETKQEKNHAWQKITLKNAATGTDRVIFEQIEDNSQFEKIAKQDWSPTNRFFFIFVDSLGTRSLLFFQTDGRFTNSRFYLQPIALSPFETVVNAKWKSDFTLEFETINKKNNSVKRYEVDFDDSSGTIKPLP